MRNSGRVVAGVTGVTAVTETTRCWTAIPASFDAVTVSAQDPASLASGTPLIEIVPGRLVDDSSQAARPER
ncbi:hypothetical protein [Nocardioides sp.]|uniref:hypothetical protein n=1 Tax=Nocardioides sp. TaxID=35761 RepID=UPI0026375FA7|nr:hypothetical protein [Nocardioides sp.]